MARGLTIRLWPAMAAALLLACGQATADDLYTVTGVAVDRTAATPQQARDSAVADGERKAFDLLMRRLTDAAQASRLPHPGDRELAALVQGFQVEQERASATHYVATLSVAFQPDAIRQLLSESGVTAVQAAGRPLLVVPIYRGGETLLWEDGNRWRMAWAEHPPRSGLVPLVVPEGDATDVASLDSGEALAGRPGAFDAIGQRYHTGGGALLVEATPGPDFVAIKATDLSGGARRDILSDRVVRAPGESDSALFARAAQQIGDALEERYRRDNLVAPGAGGTVTALIPVDGLNGWLAVRRQLQSVGLVQRLALRSLSKREAMVDIAFAGDQAQLASALAQSGLRLERTGEGWLLRGSSPRS